MIRSLRHIILPIVLLASISMQAQGLDYRILKSLESHRTPTMDKVMTFVSNTLVVAPVVPASQAVVGIAADQSSVKIDALESLTALGINQCATSLTKNVVRRPRPYVKYEGDLEPVHTTFGYSFPSGHSSIAFATATTLSLECPRWYVVAPSMLWAGSVAFSRLYLGVHYPSDVLTGALLGASSAYVAHLCYQKQREQLGLPEVKGFVVPIVLTF